jgi:serine/threonine-protein kinase
MSAEATIGPWVAVWTDGPLPGDLAAALAERMLGMRRLQAVGPAPEVPPLAILCDRRMPPPPAALLPRAPRVPWSPEEPPAQVIVMLESASVRASMATFGPLASMRAEGNAPDTFAVSDADPDETLPGHSQSSAAWSWLDTSEQVLRVNLDPDKVVVVEPSGAETVGVPGTLPPAADELQGTLRPPPPGLLAGRYERIGALGEGGMGEVFAVRDHHLQSIMAMKVLRSDRRVTGNLLSRFVAEAQATAQLQHPGIVPVHELGTLEDGRVFFTMELVQGRTLSRIMDALHAETRRLGHWGDAEGFSFRRLLSALYQATQAVAYAHARGVLHRDIKPDNIMLGSFGEVRVLDWGLARLTGEAIGDLGVDGADTAPIASADRPHTFVGTVAGTPTHMAPEQAWGRTAELGPATDVYALGATLYQLISGRPPHTGRALEALEKARSGRVPPLRPLAPVDPALVDLVEACLATEPSDRPEDAGALAAMLGDWLDGARRRDHALALVQQADAALLVGARVRERAAEVRAEAARVRGEIDAVYEAGNKAGDFAPAPLPLVRAAWAAEDRLAALAREEGAADLAVMQHLQAALHQVPTLSEAHARLATYHRARHDDAESRGDLAGAAMHEALVRTHDRAGNHQAWLAREGRLRLEAAHPQATVRLARCVERERQLVPEPLPAPLDARQALPLDLAVPAGSYVLTVEAPGRSPVTVTADVPREGVWDRTPPGGDAPRPLELPTTEVPGAAYIPAGWTWIGGTDRRFRTTLERRRVWVESFWAERHPVTNRRYLDFLNARVAQGREDEAAAHVPRYRGAESSPVYGRDADGRYILVPDADGDLWGLEWPVFLVTWSDARAFAEWWSEETGHAWRLPTEHEWRVACGGTDGRRFPWGDHPVDHYANTRNGQPGPMLPAEVAAFPTDASAHGVAGGSGGVGHWCRDPFRMTGPPVDAAGGSAPEPPDAGAVRVARGGAWSWAASDATLDMRHVVPAEYRMEILGFRLVCGAGVG